jgi:hypothetical protein
MRTQVFAVYDLVQDATGHCLGALLRYAAMSQLIICSQGSTITSNPAK